MYIIFYVFYYILPGSMVIYKIATFFGSHESTQSRGPAFGSALRRGCLALCRGLGGPDGGGHVDVLVVHRHGELVGDEVTRLGEVLGDGHGSHGRWPSSTRNGQRLW